MFLLRLNARAVADDPEWTAFDFLIDASDIFAKNAQADELHASKEQYGNHNRRKTRAGRKANFGKLLGKNFLRLCEGRAQKGKRRNPQAKMRRQPERHGGE